MLTGDYKGYMECHIKGDFLLIWFHTDTDEINLVRLGSHSELCSNEVGEQAGASSANFKRKRDATSQSHLLKECVYYFV